MYIISRIGRDKHVSNARKMNNILKNPCTINLTSSSPAGFGALNLERCFLWIPTTIKVRCTFIYYSHEGNMKPQSGEIFVA